MTESQRDDLSEVCSRAREIAKGELEQGVGDSLERIAAAFRAEAALPDCRDGWPVWARRLAGRADRLNKQIEDFLGSMERFE
jgi:hypothetical protein